MGIILTIIGLVLCVFFMKSIVRIIVWLFGFLMRNFIYVIILGVWIFKGCNYRDHGRETLINNCLNTVAKLLECFKRAKKDFIDVLTLDNFVRAETEKLCIE